MNWAYINNIAADQGNTFYLIDPGKFATNYDEFLKEFRQIYSNTHIGYSYKTNYTPRLCAIVDKRGGYAEVVSEMEYSMAIRLGVCPESIIVNGPYKDPRFLTQCLMQGSIVNLDCDPEVDIVEEAARRAPDRPISVGLRCSFPIDNNLTSRFGFDSTHPGRLRKVIERLDHHSNITVDGLHCHFPNRDLGSFACRAERMLGLAADLFETAPSYLDVGGGFFGRMSDSLAIQFGCVIPTYGQYASAVASAFERAYGLLDDTHRPKLILEPGSALAADVMSLVVQVIDIRQVGGRFIATTSGSRFNIGLISGRLNHPIQVLAAPDTVRGRTIIASFDLAGYTCIEGDYLYRDYQGKLSVGDYILLSNVGSYSVVFKPPFIMPDIPIIEPGCGGSGYRVTKRRGTVDDVLSTFSGFR